jgi:hypothetical protein
MGGTVRTSYTVRASAEGIDHVVEQVALIAAEGQAEYF